MPYISFNITTHRQEGGDKVPFGTICEHCHQPIVEGQSYTVHAVRTAIMRAPTLRYYHRDDAPGMGSGWGNFQPGDAIRSPRQVEVGDLLLSYSPQFDAYNVVRVTKTRWDGEPQNLLGCKFYGIFVDPSDPRELRAHNNGEFCVWDGDIGVSHILSRAQMPDSAAPEARPAAVWAFDSLRPAGLLFIDRARRAFALEVS